MKKGKKQMDATERCGIETRLALGTSVRQITKDLDRDLSTISREIKKRTYESFKGCYGRKNQCIHRQDCQITSVCRDCPGKGARCAICSYRNCNGCPEEASCHRRKLFHVAKHAQEEWERQYIDELVSPKIRDGPNRSTISASPTRRSSSATNARSSATSTVASTTPQTKLASMGWEELLS